jgi:hypothetical protein
VATERLPMRKLREVLRQRLVLRRSHRPIAESTGVSTGAISGVLARAREVGLHEFGDVERFDDEALEQVMYRRSIIEKTLDRPERECEWVHRERHRRGVTLELLHMEYLEQHPNGLRYTVFCDRYRGWLSRREIRTWK